MQVVGQVERRTARTRRGAWPRRAGGLSLLQECWRRMPVLVHECAGTLAAAVVAVRRWDLTIKLLEQRLNATMGGRR